ncbi:MAG: farnesyl diphosphate synthase [Polyangiaceae bacterium]
MERESVGPVSLAGAVVESFPRMLGGAGGFLSYAEPRRLRIEAALDEHLSADSRSPPALHAAMRYAVLSGGKRLRPLLCVVAAEIGGGDLDDVLPAACALEMIHAQSLVHDDLPAIDDDTIRRGRPTCHVRFGEAQAILAGDALLALAFELLASERTLVPADRVLEAIEIVARAVGRDGMAAGESADVLAEGRPGDRALLEFIHAHKAGDFIRASLLCGAVLCGAPAETRERLSVYGAALGLAFQIVDDILGETGDPRRLGKPVGRDEERRKLTFPRLLGMARSRELATTKANEAIAAVQGLGPAAEPLRALASYVLSRNS